MFVRGSLPFFPAEQNTENKLFAIQAAAERAVMLFGDVLHVSQTAAVGIPVGLCHSGKTSMQIEGLDNGVFTSMEIQHKIIHRHEPHRPEGGVIPLKEKKAPAKPVPFCCVFPRGCLLRQPPEKGINLP